MTATLPSPEGPARTGSAGHPVYYVLAWIFFSNLTILFNKWLLDSAGFRYPIILTCWHMVFTTLATQVMVRTTSFLDDRKTLRITGRIYLRHIVPIGILYSASLVFSNAAYLYLSVSFIQMLKASAPLVVYMMSVLCGLEKPSLSKLLIIVVMVVGVIIASLGEIKFNWTGFLMQWAGIVFEAMRIVIIQILLSGEGRSMNPLVSLYYYAPVCVVSNLAIIPFTEATTFTWDSVREAGYSALILNASVAFLLNVSSVLLIGKTSAVVFFLCGNLKNILLILISVMIWTTPLSFLQCFGYAISLLALMYYSLGWEQIADMFTTARKWTEMSLTAPRWLRGRTGMVVACCTGLVVLALLLLGFGNAEGAREYVKSWTVTVFR